MMARSKGSMYLYSDCPATFRMSDQLAADTVELARRAEAKGAFTASIAAFWALLEPFCVSVKGDPTDMDWWHHGERGAQMRLEYFWDKMYKQVCYFIATNGAANWQNPDRQL